MRAGSLERDHRQRQAVKGESTLAAICLADPEGETPAPVRFRFTLADGLSRPHSFARGGSLGADRQVDAPPRKEICL
jgi:hypothetical protein